MPPLAGQGGCNGGPSRLSKGSLCDPIVLHRLFRQAFCSLQHCSDSIAESNVNRFVVVKCFMGQFSCSYTFPLFPPCFSSKGERTFLVLFVRV